MCNMKDVDERLSQTTVSLKIKHYRWLEQNGKEAGATIRELLDREMARGDDKKENS